MYVTFQMPRRKNQLVGGLDPNWEARVAAEWAVTGNPYAVHEQMMELHGPLGSALPPLGDGAATNPAVGGVRRPRPGFGVKRARQTAVKTGGRMARARAAAAARFADVIEAPPIRVPQQRMSRAHAAAAARFADVIEAPPIRVPRQRMSRAPAAAAARLADVTENPPRRRRVAQAQNTETQSAAHDQRLVVQEGGPAVMLPPDNPQAQRSQRMSSRPPRGRANQRGGGLRGGAFVDLKQNINMMKQLVKQHRAAKQRGGRLSGPGSKVHGRGQVSSMTGTGAPSWKEALQLWNSKRGSWSIPKKGTKEYKQVMALRFC
jgi:hypothetical protein